MTGSTPATQCAVTGPEALDFEGATADPPQIEAALAADLPAPPLGSDVFGYLFVLGSVICNALSIHLYHLALQGGTVPVCLVISLIAAVSGFLAIGFFARLTRPFGGFEQVNLICMLELPFRRPLLLLAATFLAGTGALVTSYAIRYYGPENCAFLANLTLVYLVLFGIAAGERVRLVESLLMILITVGVVLFTYRDAQILWGAVIFMAVGCLGNAGKQFLVARFARGHNLPLTMAALLATIILWTLVFAQLTGQLTLPTLQSALLSAINGLLGSIMGMTFLYMAYQRIGVARAAAVDALRPLAVLLMGLAIGATLPGPIALLGGTLVLVGSASLAKINTRRKPRPRA